jgi:hypothetical protein
MSDRADGADVRDGLRRIEEMFDRFDDIAAQTNDAAILGEAQLQAEDCVRWLALTGGAWRNGLPDRDLTLSCHCAERSDEASLARGRTRYGIASSLRSSR